MRAAALRRAIPGAVKRRATVLRGWGYWARRRLGTSARTQVAPLRDAPAVTELDGKRLPADAPPASLARNQHGFYCVPLSSQHRPVSQAILAGEVWEGETLDLVRGADPSGDIVHAGTFFGDFIPALARSRAPGAVVWAFEPGAENHRASAITVALNDLENVTLTHAGLDASAGEAQLATADRHGVPLGGASRVIRDRARARWFDGETVDLVAVDEIVPPDRSVAAIQLDVEGHEAAALEGAFATIARCRPLIVLETLPPPEFVAEHLAPLGYESAGTVNRNFVLRSG